MQQTADCDTLLCVHVHAMPLISPHHTMLAAYRPYLACHPTSSPAHCPHLCSAVPPWGYRVTAQHERPSSSSSPAGAMRGGPQAGTAAAASSSGDTSVTSTSLSRLGHVLDKLARAHHWVGSSGHDGHSQGGGGRGEGRGGGHSRPPPRDKEFAAQPSLHSSATAGRQMSQSYGAGGGLRQQGRHTDGAATLRAAGSIGMGQAEAQQQQGSSSRDQQAVAQQGHRQSGQLQGHGGQGQWGNVRPHRPHGSSSRHEEVTRGSSRHEEAVKGSSSRQEVTRGSSSRRSLDTLSSFDDSLVDLLAEVCACVCGGGGSGGGYDKWIIHCGCLTCMCTCTL